MKIDGEVDIEEFAGRVDRLCDFLITKYTLQSTRDGSLDLVALEYLQSDAKDIAAGKAPIAKTFLDGVAEAIGGRA